VNTPRALAATSAMLALLDVLLGVSAIAEGDTLHGAAVAAAGVACFAFAVYLFNRYPRSR